MKHILLALSAGILSGVSIAQIPMSGYVRTDTSTSSLGYFFQAPVDFEVTELQVPDEQHFGRYVVALYRLKAAPPPLSSTIPVAPVFYAGGVGSHSCVKVPTTAGSFKKGDWLAVLGGCGLETGGDLKSSCGASTGANNPSEVLGIPIAGGLQRCGMRVQIGTTKGVGPLWSDVAGAVARVKLTVKAPGSAGVPGPGACDFCPPSNGNASLDIVSTHPTIIGKEARIEMKSGGTANTGAFLGYGLARGNIPIPGFGTLCMLSVYDVVPYGIGPIPDTAVGKIVTLGKVPTITPIGSTIVAQAALITGAQVPTLTNGLGLTAGR